ncbi:hypothetical protein E2C01_056473 [Portunus trituberculatus]|uniref:Uncharacterized protein n=1 Tax=Portunus trituberculatus TaxID=210409 RepID=A0A5B7GXT0_PORTR|nr:hypothetical protein [Portunus trituberculatus]
MGARPPGAYTLSLAVAAHDSWVAEWPGRRRKRKEPSVAVTRRGSARQGSLAAPSRLSADPPTVKFPKRPERRRAVASQAASCGAVSTMEYSPSKKKCV